MQAIKNKRKFDILAIGPSFVDLFIKVTDKDLEELGFMKARQRKVGVDEFKNVLAHHKPYAKASGGVATNTIATAARLGASTAWIYKLANDELGRDTVKEMNEIGVFYNTPFADSREGTGSCIIFSTPDGERTMCTYFGAQDDFSEEDVDEDTIANSSLVYLAGSAVAGGENKTKYALTKAAELTKKHGGLLAYNLFDVRTINMCREFYDSLTSNTMLDMMFGNEDEFKAYFEVDNAEDLFKKAAEAGFMSVITRGPKGATVVDRNVRVDVPPLEAEVVDTTGAGDSFAAGYLYAMAKGKDIETCAKKGVEIATAVLAHVGGRPVITEKHKLF